MTGIFLIFSQQIGIDISRESSLRFHEKDLHEMSVSISGKKNKKTINT